jgi:CelD/BcsL family acetyltransferase involved in cellulose biosynthesis
MGHSITAVEPVVERSREAPSAAQARQPPFCCFTVVPIDVAAELQRHISAWDALADAALEPNPFYESWMLLPALQAFGSGVTVALVFSSLRGGVPTLCGVFPVERRSRYRGIPVPVIRLWEHEHCSLGTPLVRVDVARGCLLAFLLWAASDPMGAALVEYPHLVADGPFHQVLLECLAERDCPVFVSDSFARAFLRTSSGGDLSGHRRRAMKRKERRLTDLGAVDYRSLEAGGNIDQWVDDFLRCEGGGWKGERGTAMACSDRNRAFFRTVATAAFQRGRLLTLALRLDGVPISIRCSFLASDGAYAFKTAYDEAYARFSPGVLLMVETMRRLSTCRHVRWMDSCTASDNSVLNALWKDRRTMVSLLTAPGKGPGRWCVKGLPMLRSLKRCFFPPGGRQEGGER